MRRKRAQDLATVGITVLILDWIVGVMCASGLMSHWIFLVLNIPFGAIYVWMESSWTGTRYQMLGLNIGEYGSLMVFLLIVAAQSLCYFVLCEWLRKKRDKRVDA